MPHPFMGKSVFLAMGVGYVIIYYIVEDMHTQRADNVFVCG